MTDQLSLSIWLERHAQPQRLRHFQTLLRLVPFSQREGQPQTTVSILAVSETEPPLLERAMNGPVDLNEVIGVLNDYKGDDLGWEVESWWDLWQYSVPADKEDWQLRPAAIRLSCFAPGFDNRAECIAGPQEDLRIEFGVDTHYLPDPSIPGSPKMVESNIRSLLRLVHEIDSTLPVAQRKLETETGENFAERLQQTLQGVSLILKN